ncbi:aldehyde dehydrogenase family protein [Alkalicoccus halolimnae]|uniref:3-sulfolactaldehyde dehydrogenase n=1 Tax=Alkalicoccus halolimnae TaxID=1667239 RepID=A0A5C7F4K6_9BACI|nr:aldehyde dehydrogenase family protein [Alkalicoccus halolimnae]TXF85591.1 aldehyde dehydrogenase family protein [Alkalicoccus halolimnae]
MTNYNKQFINGAWKEGSSEKTLENINPYSQESIFMMNSASEEDLNRAYNAAADAFPAWKDTAPAEKQKLMHNVARVMTERKKEIISWLIKEAGSSSVKAEVEFGAALAIVNESASFPHRVKGQIMASDIPGKENRIYRSPKGVIGVIGPWNFPFHLSMRSVAPAVAAGNTVVLKPASDTVVTAGTLIADIFKEAGAAAGVLNVTAGRGSEIGDAFVTHPVPKVISFTGSTEVGSHIAELAGRHIKETALELGGNNAFIVLPDADLEQAVNSAIFGKFLHQGQICMSINRLLVHEDVYDEFTSLFKERAASLPVGDPADQNTVVGPLIKVEQVERILADIKASVEQGASLIYGGQTDGTLMHPAVLTDVTQGMPIAENEIFGPAAPIIRFSTEEEAVKLANATPYGLSGAVHSSALHRAAELAKQIDSGMVHINDQPVNDEPHAAFGGEKQSGLGRFGGEWALDKFTTEKWISVQSEKRSYPF